MRNSFSRTAKRLGLWRNLGRQTPKGKTPSSRRRQRGDISLGIIQSLFMSLAFLMGLGFDVEPFIGHLMATCSAEELATERGRSSCGRELLTVVSKGFAAVQEATLGHITMASSDTNVIRLAFQDKYLFGFKTFPADPRAFETVRTDVVVYRQHNGLVDPLFPDGERFEMSIIESDTDRSPYIFRIYTGGGHGVDRGFSGEFGPSGARYTFYINPKEDSSSEKHFTMTVSGPEFWESGDIFVNVPYIYTVSEIDPKTGDVFYTGTCSCIGQHRAWVNLNFTRYDVYMYSGLLHFGEVVTFGLCTIAPPHPYGPYHCVNGANLEVSSITAPINGSLNGASNLQWTTNTGKAVVGCEWTNTISATITDYFIKGRLLVESKGGGAPIQQNTNPIFGPCAARSGENNFSIDTPPPVPRPKDPIKVSGEGTFPIDLPPQPAHPASASPR